MSRKTVSLREQDKSYERFTLLWGHERSFFFKCDRFFLRNSLPSSLLALSTKIDSCFV